VTSSHNTRRRLQLGSSARQLKKANARATDARLQLNQPIHARPAALANEGYNRSCVIGCYIGSLVGTHFSSFRQFFRESKLAVLEPLLSSRLS
jgi:hypothetical protein